jgi:hypothetical protein
MSYRVLLIGVALATALPCPARACPINYSSFRQKLTASDAVLVATLVRRTPPNPSGAHSTAVTDLVVSQVIKNHPGLAGRTRFPLPFRVPPGRFPGKVLVFASIVKGKLNLRWMGELGQGSELPRYLVGIHKIANKKPPSRLRFYAEYLIHPEYLIALDALSEFQDADYADLRKAAERLPADQLAAWLRDPRCKDNEIGILAFLLGHASKDRRAHAGLLGSLLKREVTSDLSGDPYLCFRVAWDRYRIFHSPAGVYQGLILLQPREGWEQVRRVLGDPSGSFRSRAAVLLTARFLMECRPELIPAREVVAGLVPLLEQEDLTDLVVNCFRTWKRWETTDRVLALKSRECFRSSLVRRAVLRFALSSPRKQARDFIARERNEDGESVRDAEADLNGGERIGPPK